MKKRRLLTVAFLTALFCIIALLVLPFFIDLDVFKPRIEAAASDALGMKVLINSGISIDLFPGLLVSLDDIKIESGETDVVSLKTIELGLQLYPLFRGEVKIDHIEVKSPEIYLVRFKDGNLNITPESKKEKNDEKQGLPFFEIDRLIISDGNIIYSDRETGTVDELKGLDIQINDLVLGASGEEKLLEDISFEGSIYVEESRIHELNLSDLAFNVNAEEGIYHINPIDVKVFSGRGNGEVTLDLSGTTPGLKIRTAFTGFDLEEFFDTFSGKKVMKGKADVSLKLSMQGGSLDNAKKTMNGYYSLKGESLVIRKYDIDLIMQNYRKSQNLGALDIGAFFLAGPVGAALTKGYEFEELYRVSGKGEGMIRKVISNWKIENGIAIAEDVAFSTKENRLALKGRLDFINAEYKDIIVAVTDKRGCAEFAQKINGPLNKPEFGKTSILKSVLGSVISLFNKTEKFISGRKCEVFYAGSIQYPE